MYGAVSRSNCEPTSTPTIAVGTSRRSRSRETASTATADRPSAIPPPLLCVSSQPASVAAAAASPPARPATRYLAPRGQHERGPRADEEHRRRAVRVGHREREPAVAEVALRRRAEAQRDCGRNRERATPGCDGRDHDAPVDGAAHREPDREHHRVEEGQQRIVARERRQRRPGDRHRLPAREGDQQRPARRAPPPAALRASPRTRRRPAAAPRARRRAASRTRRCCPSLPMRAGNRLRRPRRREENGHRARLGSRGGKKRPSQVASISVPPLTNSTVWSLLLAET